ncbi:MAG: hypothetical protein KDD82_29565 [Planctomycetes bacterium]|nr:hypothetical protein [Planctomycetota bacterium]
MRRAPPSERDYALARAKEVLARSRQREESGGRTLTRTLVAAAIHLRVLEGADCADLVREWEAQPETSPDDCFGPPWYRHFDPRLHRFPEDPAHDARRVVWLPPVD